MRANSDCHVTSGLTTFRITLLFIISDGSMCWAIPSSDITSFKAGRQECFLKQNLSSFLSSIKCVVKCFSVCFFSLIRHSFLDLIIHFFYFIVFCSAYLEVFFHDLRYVFTVKSVVLNLQQRSKFKHIIQGNIFVYLLLPLTAVLMAESWTRFSHRVSRFDKFPHENQQGSAVLHRKTDTASYL